MDWKQCHSPMLDDIFHPLILDDSGTCNYKRIWCSILLECLITKNYATHPKSFLPGSGIQNNLCAQDLNFRTYSEIWKQTHTIKISLWRSYSSVFLPVSEIILHLVDKLLVTWKSEIVHQIGSWVIQIVNNITHPFFPATSKQWIWALKSTMQL